MFLLTNRGSKNCLTTDIIIKSIIIAIPSFISPFKPQIIAHGIIAVPEPSIGRASTNPIPSAISNGNYILNPINLSIYKPIKEITNDTSTNVASAFKNPPNVLVKSVKCLPTFITQVFGR